MIYKNYIDDNYGSRRIHLDFHNSPVIDNIGESFNAAEFAETLKEANVDSITIFGKGTHGMCYYPTKVGKTHPGLKFDLMGKMISACKKSNISTLIYLCSMWDDHAASIHQEWLQVSKDGMLAGRHPLGTNTFREVCLNTEYVDYFLRLIEEIFNNYKDFGGFFIDMVVQDIKYNTGCICNKCLGSMESLGLDPTDDKDLRKHSKIIEQNFIEKVSNYIKGKNNKLFVLVNCRDKMMIDKSLSVRTELPYMSYLEIETLPSAIVETGLLWGYDFFQKAVRYFTTLDIGVAAMTGIFHKGWGDFGSIKNKAALEYECFRTFANGATCCIGDQPHPDALLDKERYRRIGEVYGSIKNKEKWVENAEPVKEIGVVYSESDGVVGGANEAEYGALRILLEEKKQFHFLDRENNLDDYKLIILPDKVEMDDDFLKKLNDYSDKGGKVLLSGSSGIDINNKKVLFEKMNLDFHGDLDYDSPYIKLNKELGENIEDLLYIVDNGGFKIEAKDENIDILAKFWDPYFNRTYKHFTSHFQAPARKESKYPAIIKNKNIIYIAFPIFRNYRLFATLCYKKIIKNCMDILMPEPLIKSTLPSTAELTLFKRGDSRIIMHLLHYIPVRRGLRLDVIEDVIPLFNQSIALKKTFTPSGIYSVPDMKEIDYTVSNDYINLKIPEINGHKMIIIDK